MPTEVAHGVYSIGQGHVEIYVIEDGGRLTLVDSGLKSDWKRINSEVTAMGKTLADIEAVILTHSHLDHMGNAERLRKEAGAAVHVHQDDLAQARGGERPARDPKARSMLSYGPSILITIVQFALRGGLSSPPPIIEAATFTDGKVLEVPGRPKVVHVPGHTPGSSALFLEDRGVLFTGDALISYTFFGRKTGARISPSISNEDTAEALRSLANIESLPAQIVLPGHGAPLNEGVDAAVEAARRIGSDAKD
ncbi:MAG TPA: MBL fold metallo-hydrolase [Dehalococcoidia bacterium]|nr:MBL fold metallo-hydrolase [Dehalococcoidia bacterium]